MEVLDQVQELVRHKRRVPYHILKRKFALDAEVLDDLT